MRADFLDISKAFDRVWHRGLIAKLKSIGVEGNLLNWFKSYLSCRKQRVIIRKECIVIGVISRLVSPRDPSYVHYCFSFTLMTHQPQSLLAAFYSPKIVFCWKKLESPSDCACNVNHDLTSISDWAKRWLVR